MGNGDTSRLRRLIAVTGNVVGEVLGWIIVAAVFGLMLMLLVEGLIL